jgi:hypothetical protein
MENGKLNNWTAAHDDSRDKVSVGELEAESVSATRAISVLWRRTVVVSVVIGLALAGIVNGIAGVSGQTPSPTEAPTSSPTPAATTSPTPSPPPDATPYPQTTVTIRFVRNGQPATVTILPERTTILADDVDCSQYLSDAPADVSQYTVAWPRLPNQGFPAYCSKGPPTTLRFAFVHPVRHLNPFGIAVAWTGSDITTDLEVPADIQVVSPTPASIPPFGGPPGRDAPAASTAAVAIAALVSVFAATFVVAGHGVSRVRVRNTASPPVGWTDKS